MVASQDLWHVCMELQAPLASELGPNFIVTDLYTGVVYENPWILVEQGNELEILCDRIRPARADEVLAARVGVLVHDHRVTENLCHELETDWEPRGRY
jgi:hypothetical protein